MIVVVDTNIVFSGILNPQGTISDLLLNSNSIFEFFAPATITEELGKHREKLLKLSGLMELELDVLINLLMKKIDLIDLDGIPSSIWKKAIKLTQNVDEFDTPFVALSLELAAPLWTGDKKLTKEGDFMDL